MISCLSAEMMSSVPSSSKTGTFLGAGEKDAAVPFNAVWTTKDKKNYLTMNITKDELKGRRASSTIATTRLGSPTKRSELCADRGFDLSKPLLSWILVGVRSWVRTIKTVRQRSRSRPPLLYGSREGPVLSYLDQLSLRSHRVRRCSVPA
jgi:hypothetical protein